MLHSNAVLPYPSHMPKYIKTQKRPKPNYKWFEHLLKDAQLSQREPARRLRIDPGGLNRRLKGRARLKLEEAAEIARLFNVPVDDVLTNAGVDISEQEAKKGKAVPMVGWIDGSMGVHIEKVKGLRSVAAPPLSIAGLKALRFQTAMSQVDELDGGIVYYRPSGEVDPDAIGKQCVVTLATGETALLVVRPGYQRGRYNLTNRATGQTTTDVVLESAARVVWMQM